MNEANALAIASMGTGLGPDVLVRCRALFAPEQEALAATVSVAAADCVYGPHERQRLDIYGAGHDLPVLLFVHGGGFVQGDKAAGWANAAVGRMAAREGWIGAVMNYRLAPEHGWPAGGDDVLAAVNWLRSNVSEHGGDPARIVVMGTSAGAVHVATALRLHPDLRVRGAILLSGLYGYTPLEGRDSQYYGDPSLYNARMPKAAVEQTPLPLLLGCAEHDPARFQAEFLGLMQARLDRNGAMPRGFIGLGHNHYTLAMHLGTSDRRLADAIVRFITDVCG